ncbi:hypothetical protein AK88_02270 [Plasmodium fragile]|uniref:Uncharacterized protein n=1 Tax=Plasmodium fragile TaxID=5857 RepID=A0A0D9QLP2_PLAFR|nr:uncharacterized protein AK88_02270 [Plasmodium fragile]KJP87995.1 hypothetical protein AK88_02270 [Plasmodium fragile]
MEIGKIRGGRKNNGDTPEKGANKVMALCQDDVHTQNERCISNAEYKNKSLRRGSVQDCPKIEYMKKKSIKMHYLWKWSKNSHFEKLAKNIDTLEIFKQIRNFVKFSNNAQL